MKSTKLFIKSFIQECQTNRNSQYALILQRDHTELFDQIISEFPSPKPSQSLYNFVHDITTLPTCPECGTDVKFINYSTGYQPFCSKKYSNSSNIRIDKIKQTNLKKYGHTNYCQSIEGEQKRKQHMINQYGVDHYSKTKKFKEKFTSTMEDRYGVKYAMQSDELKQRYGDSLEKNHGVGHPSQSPEIYKKRNEAMKAKYGVEHAMQSDELIKQHRETLQQNYGVDYPIQNQELHNRMKYTMLGRYGKEFSAQVDYIFEKVKQTNLDRYGVEFPLQNDYIFEKAKQTNLARYGVEFPTQNEDIKIKIRKKMEKEGKWIPQELLSEAELYYKYVIKYTNKQPLSRLDNFDKRGLAGIEDAYHVDHKVSIKYGFVHNIPPCIIGSIHNMEMLPWKDNVYKSCNCSIDPDHLVNVFYDTVTQ